MRKHYIWGDGDGGKEDLDIEYEVRIDDGSMRNRTTNEKILNRR